jgi:hypothetical protein
MFLDEYSPPLGAQRLRHDRRMPHISEEALTQLGFRFGTNGTHAARTMMLADLGALFSATPHDADDQAIIRQIVEDNVLGKPTKKARLLAARHFTALYGCSQDNPIFRALRKLWEVDPRSQPMLAFSVAMARDPLLGSTQAWMLNKAVGEPVARLDTEAFLASHFPDRFSVASLKSFAQNVNGSWTDAGYLRGHLRKYRTLPYAGPANVALALFLGYLEGRSGQSLFATRWIQLLGQDSEQLELHTTVAAHRGLLVFLNAGGVKEVRFPGYLTSAEEAIRSGGIHAI